MTVSLEQITNVTQQLAELASEKDWEALQSLATERQALLESYFENTQQPDPHALKALSDFIVKTDQHITALISQEKQQSINETLNLKSGFNAVQQYTKHMK